MSKQKLIRFWSKTPCGLSVRPVHTIAISIVKAKTKEREREKKNKQLTL